MKAVACLFEHGLQLMLELPQHPGGGASHLPQGSIEVSRPLVPRERHAHALATCFVASHIAHDLTALVPKTQLPDPALATLFRADKALKAQTVEFGRT